MEIAQSARKHGITDESIIHAWTNQIRYRVFEYRGQERMLVIGPDVNGALLELVAVPADGPTAIIHADRLRKKYHDLLR